MLLYMTNDNPKHLHALVAYRSHHDSVLRCEEFNPEDIQEGYDSPIFQFWSATHPQPINVSMSQNGSSYYGAIPRILLENDTSIMVAVVLPPSVHARCKTVAIQRITVIHA